MARLLPFPLFHTITNDEAIMSMYFTKDHEWVRVEGDIGVVGITAYAAEQLGDVVFVEVPEVGKVLEQKAEMAVVESVKAASDIYAPVAGEVVAANDALGDAAETVNADPEGEAWFCKIKIANTDQISGLMDRAAYTEYCESL